MTDYEILYPFTHLETLVWIETFDISCLFHLSRIALLVLVPHALAAV